jgi:hypothetical protein
MVPVIYLYLDRVNNRLGGRRSIDERPDPPNESPQPAQ